MKISFIIPAYNEEHYLDICLTALSRVVEGRDVEIIVVDNNSKDRTAAVAEAHKGVTLLHEPRMGANRARQTGFEASHGDFIAFLDADTKIGPGWIEYAEKEFAANPNLVCLSGPFLYYDLPWLIRKLVKGFYSISYVVYLINNFILRKASVIQGGNYIVRRKAFEKISGLNTDLTFYGDDADLAMRLNKVGLVKFSFRFPIPCSGRRLAKEGAFTMGLRYGLNYFWIVLFKRPFTHTMKEVRLKEHTEEIYSPENKGKEFVIAASVVVIFLAAVGIVVYAIYYFETAKSPTVTPTTSSSTYQPYLPICPNLFIIAKRK
jgi:glycosyltransferase involved in cell wall biosynthesis